MVVRRGAELVEKRLVLGQDARLLFIEEAVLHPCREQQFQVESCRLWNAKVGGDRLALDGRLDFAVLDVSSERRVETVGVPAASRRRSAASVEKHHGAAVFTAHVGQALLGTVDGPVGAEVAAVFGAVGEAEHDRLISPSEIEVRGVHRVRVELLHLGPRPIQILNRFKERHEVHRQRTLPPAGLRHGVQDGDVVSAGAIAEDVAVTTGLAVVSLDFLHGTKAFEHILMTLFLQCPLEDRVVGEEEV